MACLKVPPTPHAEPLFILDLLTDLCRAQWLESLGIAIQEYTFDYCDIDQVGPGTDCTPDRPGCFGEQGDSLGSARLQMALAICYHSGGDWNVYPAMGDPGIMRAHG